MGTEDEATRARILQMIGAYRTLMEQGNWDQWIDLWAEDAVLEFPFSPPGRQRAYTGKAQILAYMKAAACRVGVDGTTALNLIPAQDPNVAVVELSTRGRAIPTGRPFNQSYVIVFETKEGKLWRYREYWNPLVSIEAFGEGWASGDYTSTSIGSSASDSGR